MSNYLTPLSIFLTLYAKHQSTNKVIPIKNLLTQEVFRVISLKTFRKNTISVGTQLSINDHYPKFVVSMDETWQDNIEGVKHKHIADFLTDTTWG